jgi:predicted RNA-binding Zn-ribbon protein involved in translation (DUF1610 family)
LILYLLLLKGGFQKMKMNDSRGQDGFCPNCHEQVDWLVFAEDRTVTGEFRGGVHCEVDSWPIGEESMSYECPKCGHVLFRDERDASTFLGRGIHRYRNERTRDRRQDTIAT